MNLGGTESGTPSFFGFVAAGFNVTGHLFTVATKQSGVEGTFTLFISQVFIQSSALIGASVRGNNFRSTNHVTVSAEVAVEFNQIHPFDVQVTVGFSFTIGLDVADSTRNRFLAGINGGFNVVTRPELVARAGSLSTNGVRNLTLWHSSDLVKAVIQTVGYRMARVGQIASQFGDVSIAGAIITTSEVGIFCTILAIFTVDTNHSFIHYAFSQIRGLQTTDSRSYTTILYMFQLFRVEVARLGVIGASKRSVITTVISEVICVVSIGFTNFIGKSLITINFSY